jgi:hypothetical protein
MLVSASALWYIVGEHLSLQLCPDGSKPANEPRVESDAIHWIKPDPVLLNEGDDTFGSSHIVSGFDDRCHGSKLYQNSLPATSAPSISRARREDSSPVPSRL